jgi:hypothetical protein
VLVVIDAVNVMVAQQADMRIVEGFFLSMGQQPTVNRNAFSDPRITTAVNPVIRTVTLFFTEHRVCQGPKYWK